MAHPLLGDSFTPFSTAVSPTITISGHKAGSGPPLLLIHGFPQTHLIWHPIAPALAQTYTLVMPDLRGYGASSKPRSPDPADHSLYSKRAMAADLAALMAGMGFGSYRVCAHDRGARVAHALAVGYPERVERLMLLDICPTLAMYGATDMVFARAYWHWFFLIQPAPFPEEMILAAPEVFARKTLQTEHDSMHPEAVAAYAAQYKDPDTVHGMCEDYRAAATIDLEHQKEDMEQGRKIQCDVMVLRGSKGLIELKFKALEEWGKVCSGKVTGDPVDSGHFIPEEAPEVVLKNALEFFA